MYCILRFLYKKRQGGGRRRRTHLTCSRQHTVTFRPDQEQECRHANSKQSFDILCRREGREREEVLMRACRD